MWKIGKVEINNKVVLAPMAGISNPAYMKICEEMNLGYAITELISAEAVFRNNKKTLDMLNGIENLNIPVAIQIFGSNPDAMAKAAKTLVQIYNPKIIDINMGCPVPKVAQRAEAGSALLKDVGKVKQIVKAVVEAVNVPVTVKIRSGWDEKSINAVEVAKAIEEAGASAITIHPRTRAQGYTGVANWNIIKEVKENVNIPVIGNGDIKSCYDAKKMLEETNCDAVMIGRSALGNPWIIKETVDYLEKNIEPKQITLDEKIEIIKKHISLLTKYKSENVALLEMRSHIAWYLKGEKYSKPIKEKICKAKTIEEMIKIIDEFKENN